MKVWLSIFALAAILAMGVLSPGSAHQVLVGKLKIPAIPWVREAAEGAPGTYSCIIEIQNDGDEPERLLRRHDRGCGNRRRTGNRLRTTAISRRGPSKMVSSSSRMEASNCR